MREVEEQSTDDDRPSGDDSKDGNAKPAAATRIEIEVSPGVYLPMHRAKK